MGYDYVIVGGGPAGCVLAARLSEDPTLKVLLLEAGGGDWNPLFKMPAGFAKMTKGVASWGWSTVPQKHLDGRVIWYTQAKIIGGGSTINAQLYTRGNAKDYDAWVSEAGCKGWSYKEVLPYFKRSEDNQRLVNAYHGYGGPLGVSYPVNPVPISFAFLRAAQEAGIPFNDDFNGAVAGRHRPLPAHHARRDAQLRVLGVSQARARAPQSDGAHRRPGAQGRRRERPRGRRRRRRGRRRRDDPAPSARSSSPAAPSARRVCCSSRGSDPPTNCARPASPSCTTFPASAAICRTISISTSSRNARATTPTTAWRGSTARSGRGCNISCSRPARSPRPCSRPAASGTPTANARSPDIQFHLGLGSGIEAGVAQMRNPGVTLNSAFLRPRSRGAVRLASADPAAAPLIDPNYWADPYDRQCALKGLRLAREIMRQPALKPFVLAERLPGDGLDSDEELAQYAYRSCKTDHHPAGTCAMGSGPDAVDDARPASARTRRLARRRRLGDAVRAVVQHQRADDHGRGKGGRHDPRPAAAAGGEGRIGRKQSKRNCAYSRSNNAMFKTYNSRRHGRGFRCTARCGITHTWVLG